MFWGTEVKDVQAITTWDNILISRLICGIPLHAFLSKAAWRTNNQHGRRERQGRQRAQHRGQRRKEKRKQVPEGEKASRNGQDGQGVGEATGDVGEGPGVHVTHIQYTQTSLPWPLHLGLTLTLSTQERHQKVCIKPEIEASDLLVSHWSFQLLRQKNHKLWEKMKLREK